MKSAQPHTGSISSWNAIPNTRATALFQDASAAKTATETTTATRARRMHEIVRLVYEGGGRASVAASQADRSPARAAVRSRGQCYPSLTTFHLLGEMGAVRAHSF